jgi:hypothetical protein
VFSILTVRNIFLLLQKKNRIECDKLKESVDQFKLDFETSLYARLSEKFRKDLDDQMDNVN